MLEIPEALVIAHQISQMLTGRKIDQVFVAHSPHQFAFYNGDPQSYPSLLQGKAIICAEAVGGLVKIKVGEPTLATWSTLVFGDGAAIRYCPADSQQPDKHQLLLGFDDGSALSVSIQMYGGIWYFRDDDFENPYYRVACVKPSPLSDAFDRS